MLAYSLHYRQRDINTDTYRTLTCTCTVYTSTKSIYMYKHCQIFSKVNSFSVKAEIFFKIEGSKRG